MRPEFFVVMLCQGRRTRFCLFTVFRFVFFAIIISIQEHDAVHTPKCEKINGFPSENRFSEHRKFRGLYDCIRSCLRQNMRRISSLRRGALQRSR